MCVGGGGTTDEGQAQALGPRLPGRRPAWGVARHPGHAGPVTWLSSCLAAGTCGRRTHAAAASRCGRRAGPAACGSTGCLTGWSAASTAAALQEGRGGAMRMGCVTPPPKSLCHAQGLHPATSDSQKPPPPGHSAHPPTRQLKHDAQRQPGVALAVQQQLAQRRRALPVPCRRLACSRGRAACTARL